jgi:deoxyribodipyrimidine photo-lyase
MVDAGMRELWLTGSMHNRVRMVVGSFLVKNLLLDWRHGERWFWDCLVDADLASNSASWQWVAGCGADAAPYFRIFNPVTQGEKFDPDGQYIKEFIPELKDLPIKYLFSPWEAPKEILDNANITLGKDYPEPIIDLKSSREKALDAFKSLKKEEA